MNLAEWILVTEQDMLDEFKKTSIELGGVPADATFLLGDAHVKAGDYTFNQGKLHQFKGYYGMKGFRAWFTSTNTNPENQAKPMGVEISGVQGDEVTGLDFVEITQSNAASSVIYDLRGQKMNAKSIDELPRGIYIVNNKKYVVK